MNPRTPIRLHAEPYDALAFLSSFFIFLSVDPRYGFALLIVPYSPIPLY